MKELHFLLSFILFAITSGMGTFLEVLDFIVKNGNFSVNELLIKLGLFLLFLVAAYIANEKVKIKMDKLNLIPRQF